MIKVFGHPISHNVRKVTWALEELGRDYELELVNLLEGEQKQPEFLALNPNGRVPVLQTGDLTLYESNAILLWLARTSGRLLGSGEQDRAHAEQWLLWQAADVAATFLDPWLMRVYASMGQPLDEARHRALVEAAAAPLAVLDAHLDGRDHVVGASLTIADIALAESIGLAEVAGIPLDASPAVQRWFGALAARPAFARTRPPA